MGSEDLVDKKVIQVRLVTRAIKAEEALFEGTVMKLL